MYVVRDQLMEGGLQWNHRQFLRDIPARGGRLLDVGCGTGEFLAAAQSAGYQVTGFDFDAQAIQKARDRFRLSDLFAGDLVDLRQRYGTQRFDVVTAFEVLEHNPNPLEFIRTLSQAVLPKGFLAISVPNRNRWPAFRYDWDNPPNHLTRWSQGCLSRLLEENGFRILRVATGWRQGESYLHQRLQFGVVSCLLRGRKTEGCRNGYPPQGDASRLALMAFRVKYIAVN